MKWNLTSIELDRSIRQAHHSSQTSFSINSYFPQKRIFGQRSERASIPNYRKRRAIRQQQSVRGPVWFILRVHTSHGAKLVLKKSPKCTRSFSVSGFNPVRKPAQHRGLPDQSFGLSLHLRQQLPQKQLGDNSFRDRLHFHGYCNQNNHKGISGRYYYL